MTAAIRVSFTQRQAEALVSSSLSHEHDALTAFEARAKLITKLLADPAYVPPGYRVPTLVPPAPPDLTNPRRL